MTLSVRTLWVGFDKSAENAVLVIVNEGTPTEVRLAFGPWCAIEGAPEIGRRGARLLRKELFVDDVPSQIQEGPEQPIETKIEVRRLNG